MRLFVRLTIALILAISAMMPLGISVSLEIGQEITIEGQDSLEGVTTISNNELVSTSALFATGLIQTAVDKADPGDTIFLQPKTYYDNVDVWKDLEIRGWGPRLTIVDGQRQGSVFKIDEGVTATLSDMTIKNGGQAADNNYLTGGGVYNLGTLTLRRCEITRNSAMDCGGVFSGDTLIVDSCRIWNNHADNVAGGIGINGGTLTVRNSDIYSNFAGENGGGITNFGATATISNSRFSGNTAAAGGAILTTLGGNTVVDRCTFMNNKAIGTGIGAYYDELLGYGGAVYDQGTMAITNSVFFNNFASNINGGGAIFVEPNPGGTLTQNGNIFAFNRPNNIAP
jgi:hypothetical protein